MCKGFKYFLHHFVLAKLATSSIRVKRCLACLKYEPHEDMVPSDNLNLISVKHTVPLCPTTKAGGLQWYFISL